KLPRLTLVCMLNVTAPAGQETHTFPSSAPAAYAVGAFCASSSVQVCIPMKSVIGSETKPGTCSYLIPAPPFRSLADQLMLPWVFEKLDRQASASITMRVLNGRHGHGRGA
ncbi:hypothetical protein, partial [Ensifer canadensis]|uniref:hypothetical protein n=1 Tax=Ensifer canadensis TaxID=555315 RepID=UPI00193EC7E9